MNRLSMTVAAILLASALASACGGSSTGTQQGTAAADKIRQDVAAAFWQLDDSLGRTVLSTGGLGGFGGCSGSPDSLAYGITAAMQTSANSQQDLAEFTMSILPGFAAAGWPLTHTSDDNYSAKRSGLTVSLHVFSESSGPGASLTVQSGCVDVGSAAQTILSHYSGDQSDQYPQSEASAKPVPTTFPTPGG